MRANIIPLFNCRPTTSHETTKGRALSRPGHKWRLWDRERAEEVYGVYIHKSARVAIARAVSNPGGDELWNMILAAIDAGFVTPNRAAVFNEGGSAPLRLLFPHAPGSRNWRSFFCRYHLTSAQHREYIRTVIMPVAIANREAVIANPDCLERLVEEHIRAEERRRAAEHRKDTERKAIEALPPGEQLISMYGMQIWPHPSYMTYSYDQAKAACYYFNDLLHMLDQSACFNTPKSKAMAIRFSTRAIVRFADRAVIALVDAIANAMEVRPDEPCRMPPNPTDGRW